jgi:hypothetical protein
MRIRLSQFAVLASVIAFGLNVINILLGRNDQFFSTWQVLEPKIIDDDGCGIDHAGDDGHNFLANPRYMAFNDADIDTYKLVDDCLKRLILPGGTRYPDGIDPTNLTMLQCELNVTLELFQSHASQYDTIWFFGDSLVQQQYVSFLCMVDPSLDRLQYNLTRPFTNIYEPPIYWHAMYNNSLGDLTRIVFSRFGFRFDPAQPNLYIRGFPDAVATMTANDAIVVGASAHYRSTFGSDMERALTFIANQSLVAAAPIFYMENAAEEWPTSNGLYTQSCMRLCTCEPVNSERILGHGSLTTFNNNTYLKDVVVETPDTDFFGRLYPDMQFPNNESVCIPDCLPGSWRMDLANAIFLNKKRNSVTYTNNLTTFPNRVHYVPVWRQLIASGVSNARVKVGDCTHKSLNSIMIMNQQLLRTMIKAKPLTSRSPL